MNSAIAVIFIVFVNFLHSTKSILSKKTSTEVHDYIICGNKNTTLPCNHQIEPDLRKSVNCSIEYFQKSDCPEDDVKMPFHFKNLPFNLQAYKYESTVLRTVTLNISFPHPKWKSMTMHLENQNKCRYRLCRRFSLEKTRQSLIPAGVFFDCLLFGINEVEANAYDLTLQNDQHLGGTYSFIIPAADNHDIDSSTVVNWHVFFFVHQHYLHRSGRVIITLQPAPFSNISYAVVLAKCVSSDEDCVSHVVKQTIFINQRRYSESKAIPLTLEMESQTVNGFYKVTIQILSPLCPDNQCAVSTSPTFEMWQPQIVEALFGMLGGAVALGCFAFVVLRKLHFNFSEYLRKKALNMDTVLLVYHVESETKLDFLKHLSQVLLEKFTVRPLLVDRDVGSQDPNDWTRHYLFHASRVLFVVPKDPEAESASPIHGQWKCALRYFCGSFMKVNNEQSERCATLFLPDSRPLIQGESIYTLTRFDLCRDLTFLADWFHRRSVLDRTLLWRTLTKAARKQLSQDLLVVSTCAPVSLQTAVSSAPAGVDDVKDGQWCVPTIDEPSWREDNGTEDKTAVEFNPLIPDVHCVKFSTEHDDSDEEHESSTDEEDMISDDDVMNFAS